VVNLGAHRQSGLVTLCQFAERRYDVDHSTLAITFGRVTFALPGLSIMQVIVPLAFP
jgi:hypothetical protein